MGDGATGTDRGGNDARLGQLCIAGAGFTRRFGVQFNAVWTLRGQGDGDRDKLFLLHAECAFANAVLSKAQNAFMASGAFSSIF